jgi:hypothetical protein
MYNLSLPDLIILTIFYESTNYQVCKLDLKCFLYDVTFVKVHNFCFI